MTWKEGEKVRLKQRNLYWTVTWVPDTLTSTGNTWINKTQAYACSVESPCGNISNPSFS